LVAALTAVENDETTDALDGNANGDTSLIQKNIALIYQCIQKRPLIASEPLF
jgi:hypothetical protein